MMLLKIMSKSIRSTGIDFKTIVNVIKNNLNEPDSKIVGELVLLVKNPASLYTDAYNKERSLWKWNIIKEHIPRGESIRSILDYGGNVGDVARAYGDILNLTKEKIFVVDVDEWSGEKWTPRDDITFIHYDNMDKLPTNSIDMITIQHVMHHIDPKEFPKIIDMFNRVLTKDGFIVLYEHNSRMDDFSTLIDLEHHLFDVVASKKTSYDKFVKSFYAKYFNISQWETIFSKHFKDYFTLETYSADRSFYMFLKKK